MSKPSQQLPSSSSTNKKQTETHEIVNQTTDYKMPIFKKKMKQIDKSNLTDLFPKMLCNWKIYYGLLRGRSVYLDNLTGQYFHKISFFGKGTLSNNKPDYNKFQTGVVSLKNKPSRRLKVISKRRYLRHKKWSLLHKKLTTDDMEIYSDSEEFSPSIKKHCTENISLINEEQVSENSTPDFTKVDKKSSQKFQIKNKNVKEEKFNLIPCCSKDIDDYEFKPLSDNDSDELDNDAKNIGYEKQNVPIIDFQSFDHRSLANDKNSECLVVDDSDVSDVEKTCKPWLNVKKELPFKMNESIQLTLHEAFFLCYALGILIVKDEDDKEHSILDLWRKCCTVDKKFIEFYSVYHHFRAKGWIVKSGMKYGTHFLLYKDGPIYYHATYAVQILVNDQTMSWTALSALNRIQEQVGKDLLICHVTVPDDLNKDTPHCLKSIDIEEFAFKRWKPSNLI